MGLPISLSRVAATFHKPKARLLFHVKSERRPRESLHGPSTPPISAWLLPEALHLHGTFSASYLSCAHNHSASQVCIPTVQQGISVQSRCSVSDAFVSLEENKMVCKYN